MQSFSWIDSGGRIGGVTIGGDRGQEHRAGNITDNGSIRPRVSDQSRSAAHFGPQPGGDTLTRCSAIIADNDIGAIIVKGSLIG
jgi:hypothetical protein